MADLDAIKKLTDFLKELDNAGVSASKFVQSLKAPPTGAPVAALKKKLDRYQSSDTSYKFHDTLTPCVGGVDGNGVWTGHGKGQRGKFTKGYYCYRNLDLSHKTLSELSKITEKCKEGLEDKPEYHLSLATEKNDNKLSDVLRELETFVTDHGLEGCFNLFTPKGKFNAFRHFGRISQEMANTWIDDVLKDGVLTSPSSTIRYELCPYDSKNMEISGETILRSCTPALKRVIMRKIKVEDRNGVSVFFCAIQNGKTYQNANVRLMCNALEAKDIREYKGENVLEYSQDALDNVEEIRISSQKEEDVADLVTIAIKGLSLGSDEGLCAEVRTIMKAASKPDSTYTPESALTELSEYYVDACLRKVYGPDLAPSASAPPQGFQAYVQQKINRATDRLTQVRTPDRGGRGGGGGQGSNGGGAGRGNGPEQRRHVSVSSGDTGDAETNKKVNDLIKAHIAAHGTPTDDGDPDVKDGSDIVAKYCNKCRRWNKGNKIHYTRECHRQEALPAPNPPNAPASDNSSTNHEGNLTGGSSISTSDLTNSTPEPSNPAPPTGMLSLRGADYDTPVASSRSTAFGGMASLKGYGGRGY